MSMTISNNSEMVSSLFSSFNQRNNTSAGLYGVNLADYASIRTGGYGKLLKAYYANVDSESSTAKAKENSSKVSSLVKAKETSTAIGADSKETISKIESAASTVTDATKELMASGDKSVFAKKDGAYDTDAIYKKINAFAESYNSLVTEAGKSRDSSIKSAVSSLTAMTDSNAMLLGKMGITISEEDKTLKVDETKFKDSNMDTVQAMFKGTGSFAYQVSAKANMIDYYAQYESSKAATYNGSGSYSNNYSNGSIYASSI